MISYTATGIADVLGCFGLPTGTAMQIYNGILDKRTKEAMEILLSEVRQGSFKNVHQDEIVSVVARFQRDAMEGTAKNNLRLMARVINGMAKKEELKAPSFLNFANVLSGLTEEEITVLAFKAAIQKEENIKGNPYLSLQDEHNRALKDLNLHQDEYESIQWALLRTGLLSVKLESIGDVSYEVKQDNMYDVLTESHFYMTALMDQILKYVDNVDSGVLAKH